MRESSVLLKTAEDISLKMTYDGASNRSKKLSYVSYDSVKLPNFTEKESWKV